MNACGRRYIACWIILFLYVKMMQYWQFLVLVGTVVRYCGMVFVVDLLPEKKRRELLAKEYSGAELEQVVVERMLGAGGYSLAPLEYKTFASHCWLKAWPNATKYALALLCHASTLHTNCLAKAADKLAAVDAVKRLHRARCRQPIWHAPRLGGGGGGRARLKGVGS